jgi:hypothetical protein
MGILVFLVVLTGGLLYEWNIGKLEWSKWMKKFSCIKQLISM